MAVAVLDRRVFHLALHPYYNQLWGMLTLPFTLVAAHTYAISPSRRRSRCLPRSRRSEHSRIR